MTVSVRSTFRWIRVGEPEIGCELFGLEIRAVLVDALEQQVDGFGRQIVQISADGGEDRPSRLDPAAPD